MSDTGRLRATLGPRTRRIVYGALTPTEIAAQAEAISEVDRAHLVMLAEQGLIAPDIARDLLVAVDGLRAGSFADLAGLPAPRGVYLMYEDHLSGLLGPDVGGVLHTGRSRNDLKATTTAMSLRTWALEHTEQATRLHAVLLSRARAHRHVVMPVYTHFQAAMPITYGYYLLGVARALSRDIHALRAAAGDLDTCPLGASAVAGTDLPIDPARTAHLLGFTSAASHALDAVASRDAALRLLAAGAGAAVTLSRLAADLQVWSTAEFGFVRFPERLVGGSSAMPQKRNAFLLEHVKAVAGRAVGAWSGAAAAIKSAPFTNSIEVGTEAMADIEAGLGRVADSVALCQVLVSGARPVASRMRERAENGFTTATAAANRLVAAGVPFRAAHHAVGAAVRAAVDRGENRLNGEVQAPSVDEAVVEQRHGGGPGAFDASFQAALADWNGHRDWVAARTRAARDTAAELDTAVARVKGQM